MSSDRPRPLDRNRSVDQREGSVDAATFTCQRVNVEQTNPQFNTIYLSEKVLNPSGLMGNSPGVRAGGGHGGGGGGDHRCRVYIWFHLRRFRPRRV